MNESMNAWRTGWLDKLTNEWMKWNEMKWNEITWYEMKSYEMNEWMNEWSNAGMCEWSECMSD